MPGDEYIHPIELPHLPKRWLVLLQDEFQKLREMPHYWYLSIFSAYLSTVADDSGRSTG